MADEMESGVGSVSGSVFPSKRPFCNSRKIENG